MEATPTAPRRVDWRVRELADLLSQARRQRAQLERELAALDQLERQTLELNATRLPWTSPGPELELARELEAKGQEVVLRLENVVSLLGRALELDPHCAAARSRLADLYWLLFSRAEERGEHEAAAQHLALLALHDDGRYADLVEGTGTLQVESNPQGARVSLRRLSGEDAAGEVDLGCTPVDPTDLPPGSYLLTFTLADHAPAVRPVLIHRGADVQVHVRLFSSREVGPDFQHVPAGRFVMGGDRAAPGAGPLERPFIDNFAVARYPVTLGEYMVFLDELSGDDPGQALRFAPLPVPATQRDPRLPVTGISFDAAVAYCRWISARTGWVHRLPTEEEWEKAARGADGRLFPWGDRFDPTLCQMRRSRPGAPRKDRIGSFPADRSVYGVHDLAGGVSEWTSSGFGGQGASPLQVVRGGAYDDGAESCRCACRLPAPHEPQPGLGFRLVRPLAPGGGDRVTPARVATLPSDPEEASTPAASPVVAHHGLKEALDLVLAMAGRLAASDAPAALLPQLLAETVQLVPAERGLLVRCGDPPRVLEARTAHGEPIPTSDHGFDLAAAQAALRQRRTIVLADDHPLLAVPLPDDEHCLLLERRFHRSSPFGEDSTLVARAVADPLALAIRLAGDR